MKFKRRRLSEVEKRRVVADFERSGMSQREYVGKVGIGLSTLSLWRRQISLGKKPRLLEVNVSSGLAESGRGGYRLSLPGGIGIEVERGFDVAEVRALLEVMREAR